MINIANFNKSVELIEGLNISGNTRHSPKKIVMPTIEKNNT